MKILKLILTSLFIELFICNSCKDTLQICEFMVPKSPIHNAVKLYHTGASQSECEMKIERFDWSIGLYCEGSSFCGVGLDNSKDWSSFVSSAVEPVRELCRVIVDVSKMSCHQFKQNLFHIGIMRGTDISNNSSVNRNMIQHEKKYITNMLHLAKILLLHVKERREKLQNKATTKNIRPKLNIFFLEKHF